MGPPGGAGQHGGSTDENGQGGEALLGWNRLARSQTMYNYADTVITKQASGLLQPGGDEQNGRCVKRSRKVMGQNSGVFDGSKWTVEEAADDNQESEHTASQEPEKSRKKPRTVNGQSRRG